ncbi:MAG: hypothetical protein RTV72_12575 [Candidatus Thorarchaeota archaeon]
MKGKVLAISWITGVVMIWLFIAFLFAQISASTIDGETVEHAFMEFLTNVYVIGFSLFLGSIAGVFLYGQVSEAMGMKRRKEEKKMQSMGETTL